MTGSAAGQGLPKGCRVALTVAGVLVACGLVVALLAAVALHQVFRDMEHASKQGCADSEVELIRAAEAGDLVSVRANLAHGGDPGVQDDAGNSPLACAGPRGHGAVVRFLLAKGASPNSTARDGDRVLGDAVAFCRPGVAGLLLDAGADPEKTGRGTATPLTLAVEHGDAAMVTVLLDHHADPRSFTGRAAAPTIDLGSRESTSTCPAASPTRVARALAALLRKGGLPDAVLGAAAEAGSTDVARAALAKGADPDAAAAHLPLGRAVAQRDRATVQVLLAADADPNLTPGRPALTFGVVGCHQRDGLRCDAIAGLMAFDRTARPPDPSTTTKPITPELWFEGGGGSTTDGSFTLLAPPLTQAAWQGDADLVADLLAAGADPNAVTAPGFTPLHAAAASGDARAVKLLLDAGAVAPHTDAVAPSAIAVEAGHPKVAATLRAIGS